MKTKQQIKLQIKSYKEMLLYFRKTFPKVTKENLKKDSMYRMIEIRKNMLEWVLKR